MKHQNFVMLTFVVAAILTGMVVDSAVVSVLAQIPYPDSPLLGGVLDISSASGIAGFVIAFVAMIRNARWMQFTDEVIAELFKVTWPSREEAVRATTTVVFTTLLVAGLMAFYDLVWKNVADWVLFNEA